MTDVILDDRTTIPAFLAAQLQSMTEALTSGRPENVTAMYAEDAVILGFPGAHMPFAPLIGREEISQSWREAIARKWTIEVLDVKIQGDQAVQYGRSILEIAEQRFDTAFVCFWKRNSSGAWQIHADIFKSWSS